MPGETIGPLRGLKVVELAGKGPAPYCGMLLSDLGAEVWRIERPDPPRQDFVDPLLRGRHRLCLDMKDAADLERLLSLVEEADVVVEGFRPGVAERLGVGPEVCSARNPKLIYGRATGWGQDGPLAQAAGHDLNYLALTGALYAMGSADRPPPAPLALTADFGGGGLLLAFGVMAALWEAGRSGKGQVVDAAMVDGVASMMSFVYGLKGAGWWRDDREANLLDGGAPFYRCYETKDGKYVSLSPIEPAFFAEAITRLGLRTDDLPKRMDRVGWPLWRARLEELFKTKTRDEWCALLEGTDVCFAPVLSLSEAPDHPQNRARGTFVNHQDIPQPAPVPRFSRTPGAIQDIVEETLPK